MHLLILLICVQITRQHLILSNLETEEIREKYLSDAIVAIIQRKHESFANAVPNIVMAAKNHSHLAVQQRVLQTILQRTTFLVSKRVGNYSLILPIDSMNVNIFLISDLESFNQVATRLEYLTLHSNSYGYYVFVITEKPANLLMFLGTMFKVLYRLSITRMIAICNHPDNETIVNIYHFRPFQVGKCENTDPILLNRFKDGKFENNQLRFRIGINNYHKCNLKVLILRHSPFVISRPEMDPSRMDGIDVELLKLLTWKLNFTAVLNRNFSDRGEVFPNGTVTGAMAMLRNGTYDLFISGVPWRPARNKYFLPSTPYWYLSMLLAVPVNRPRTGIENLLLPFGYYTWMMSVTLFLASALLFTVLRRNLITNSSELRNECESSTPIALASVWLGDPISRIGQRITFRLGLFLCLIGTLILRAAYQGKLYDYLQGTRVDTKIPIQEYVDQGYEVFTFHLFEPAAEKLGFPLERVKITPNMTKSLENLSCPSVRYVALVQKPVLDYYASQNWSRPLTRIHSENVMTLPVSIYFRKNSYLGGIFDRALSKILGSGVMEKISRKFNNRSTAKAIKIHNKYSIQQLGGCFEIYLFMISAAIVCFVCELLSRKILIFRVIMDFLNE